MSELLTFALEKPYVTLLCFAIATGGAYGIAKLCADSDKNTEIKTKSFSFIMSK